MRALTLWQPWAWLVVQGLKTIENRTWRTGYRGPLLIHAAARRPVGTTYLEVRQHLASWGRAGIVLPEPEELPLGGIVGAAELVGILPRLRHLGPGEKLPEWRMLGQYGYQLARIRRMPFVPCSGRQGLWFPSHELLERLAA